MVLLCNGQWCSCFLVKALSSSVIVCSVTVLTPGKSCLTQMINKKLSYMNDEADNCRREHKASAHAYIAAPGPPPAAASQGSLQVCLQILTLTQLWQLEHNSQA